MGVCKFFGAKKKAGLGEIGKKMEELFIGIFVESVCLLGDSIGEISFSCLLLYERHEANKHSRSKEI